MSHFEVMVARLAGVQCDDDILTDYSPEDDIDYGESCDWLDDIETR